MTLLKKILLSLSLICIFIVATALAWLYSQIDGSLAKLSGKITVWGLTSTAIVERDAQGIVTIKAENRLDTAVALGFIHAQERFFQMDLLRRNAAGELSSLFGAEALNHDKSIRVHRFRDRARDIVQHLPAAELALLKAYTKGVNQGLGYLGTAPFEYLILRQEPVEWQEEDSILTVFSMYLDLQQGDGRRERSLGLLKAVVENAEYQFFTTQSGPWEAAIDQSHSEPISMPQKFTFNRIATPALAQAPAVTDLQYRQSAIGSNSYAISGQLTNTGSAMLANDMHLNLSVPNTWFRASLQYQSDDQAIIVTGVTLPGSPNIVVGSNGHIAWGFTNSYGDFSDLIKLKTNTNQSQYLTDQGWRDFSYKKQIIAIKAQEAQEIIIKETIWGPVLGTDAEHHLLALRWVAHDQPAVNYKLTELEQATSIEQAFSIAANSGMPQQNLLVADKQGNIGWTISGALPIRSANFGEVPTDWSTGEHQWLGYLSAEQYPKVINPDDNRLWTANARVVGAEMLQKIGDGGYSHGARAQQIRDNLFSTNQFNEQSMLAVALDDKATFLMRWRDFIVNQLLTEKAIGQDSRLIEAKAILLQQQPLHATIDSVAYRLVRTFRLKVRASVLQTLNEKLSSLDHQFSLHSLRHGLEASVWQLISEQPDNFLTEQQGDWQQLLMSELRQTITEMTEQQALTQASWGQQNISKIQHPLAKAVPLLSPWLSMPEVALAGDTDMPRVQGSAFGASQRMVVSPGHEQQGIMLMPSGQSGHPWSPFFQLGHQHWLQGKPAPLLPGKTEYSLTLLSY